MSEEFRNDFLAYLDAIIDDVQNVKGTEKEKRKQLIEIAQDIVETIENRLQLEDEEE